MPKPTILITGASHGLGAEIARTAAGLGAGVALMARSNELLQNLSQEIEAAGGSALAVPGDVTQTSDCRRVIDQVVGTFGRLDGLVNNAGVIKPINPIAEADLEKWAFNMDVNLLGPVRLTQFAIPHLRSSHGRVIHISSGAAVKVIQGWGAYCAAKAALNHFSRVLAVEEPEITSIALRPGVINTRMQEMIRKEGQVGMPEEEHTRFIRYYENQELLPPEVPGRAAAILALSAPREWSGEFIDLQDQRLIGLIAKFKAESSQGN